MLSGSFSPIARAPGPRWLVPGNSCPGSQVGSRPPVWQHGGSNGQSSRHCSLRRRSCSTSAPTHEKSDKAPLEVAEYINLAEQDEDAEGTMLRALRNVFAMQSVTPEAVSNIMSKVDSKGDGVADLKDLCTALSKWLALIAHPGSRNLLEPFARARDIALDSFIAMKLDPRRGMGPPQLRNVLQMLCLATRSSFDVIEDWVEATLLLPDLRLSQADNLAALEIDAALQAKGPELMNGLLQRRRLAMLFQLWDPQARGGVSRLALAAVLEFYYRDVVGAKQSMGNQSNQAEIEMSIPFDSQAPRAPESFKDANVHPSPSQPPAQSQGTQGKAATSSSEDHGGGSPNAASPAPASQTEADCSGQPTQVSSSNEAAQQSRSQGSLPAEGQEDGNAEDDPVIAFLEAEMREQPSMLDMEGFQELVRRFSDLAGIPAEEAFEFLLEAALHGAIYTGSQPEETISYLRDQAEDALET